MKNVIRQLLYKSRGEHGTFSLNRYQKEWLAVLSGVAFLLIVQRLYNEIESLSRAFKINPQFTGGIDMIPKDITFAFIGLILHLIPLSCWWLSIRGRVIQRGLKKVLLAAHTVMLGFIIISFLQCYVYDTNLFLLRLTGQAVAIVMSYIPLFTFWAALCMNQDIDYVPELRYKLLVIPCSILALAGITDEFHHQILLRFKDENYNLLTRPNYGFYIFFAWILFFYILKIIIILKKGNKTDGHKLLKRLPISFIIFLLLLLFHNINNQFAGEKPLIELTSSYMFLEALTWECMIFSGMAQVNFEHKSAFKLSGIPMEIRDLEGNIYDKSISMDNTTDEVLRKLKEVDKFEVDEGTVYHRKSLPGGDLIWKTHTGEIRSYNDKLKLSNNILMESQLRLEDELKLEEEEAKLAIREQLYQKIYQDLKPQLNLLRSMMLRLKEVDKEECIKPLLLGINLISVFIKRYVNCSLIAETEEFTRYEESRSCLREIKEVLKDTDADISVSEGIEPKRSIKAVSILTMLKCFILLLEYSDFNCNSFNFIIKEREKDIEYYIEMRYKAKDIITEDARMTFYEFVSEKEPLLAAKILDYGEVPEAMKIWIKI